MTPETIDPNNPPACTILVSDGKTRPWVGERTLKEERAELPGAIARHLHDPVLMCRPMCIVRLKAFK